MRNTIGNCIFGVPQCLRFSGSESLRVPQSQSLRVSEFQSLRVSEFHSLRVSESQSSTVSESQSSTVSERQKAKVRKRPKSRKKTRFRLKTSQGRARSCENGAFGTEIVRGILGEKNLGLKPSKKAKFQNPLFLFFPIFSFFYDFSRIFLIFPTSRSPASGG